MDVFEDIATRACDNYQVEDAGADQFLIDFNDTVVKKPEKKGCC